MRISLVIPTLNEEECIGRVLDEIPCELFSEILVVDGHSTDGTVEVVRSLGHGVTLQEGKGYGNAVLAGFAMAKSEIIAMLDADGSQDPDDFHAMFEKLSDGFDLVVGSRYADGGKSDDDTIIRYLGNKLFTWLGRFLFGLELSDILYLQAVFAKSILDRLDLKSQDFGLCVEILIRARQEGYRIAEVPCVERPRYAHDSKVNALSDGWSILKLMLTLKADEYFRGRSERER